MTKMVWFLPKAGRLVPVDPVNQPGVNFPPEGESVPLTTYISRRVRDGDGEIVPAPAASVAAAPVAAADAGPGETARPAKFKS